ncbi:DNA-binding protein [Pelagicoccus albus]|uniref:DNA-binding protein n=1 Tax=Pelagicoccus albus TaxID=415222 RepID=A0A7X1B405_9BACT|nr:DNA-binding protein [Pelagicoccus albus]
MRLPLLAALSFAILPTSSKAVEVSSVRPETYADLEAAFQSPNEDARPWVFWYWMRGAISLEGITADLEAMAEAGIGGAYLMPIFGVDEEPLYEPASPQLSPEFWERVDHSFAEAERLGLRIAMHASDGFAVAGGPWIKPEESMQKVVWSKTFTRGDAASIVLPQPESLEGYYQDIATFAYPRRAGEGESSNLIKPQVTSSVEGDSAQRLADPLNSEPLRSEEPCWIQYEFETPFTCRSLVIRPHSNNYQSNRIKVLASEDGETFRLVRQLESPRHGWQDGDAQFTHSIEETTARYFRFEYDPTGSSPGSEDLDRAKWRTVFKIRGIELYGDARIHAVEGKSGLVWRIDRETTVDEAPLAACIDPSEIIELSDRLSPDGALDWDPPVGEWTILRMGHTTTGHTNATGGAGKGLEVDKFNPVAIEKQFDHWFGEALRVAGPDRAGSVLSGFHVDSWECGSQNWSPFFRDEFEKRRGYDIVPYLPLFAGVPIESAERSEEVLRDVRETIGELVVDKFYGTMAKLAKDAGCDFSCESVAPTMMSDGIAHFQNVDFPMGEFWLQSPTHDKPNDMLDAISGAHVYGKRIVQAEAFTQLRMAWDEHPGMLKTLGDQNFARGINRFSIHVFTHNPFMDRVPGVTLNGVGLYFQRDQIWWKMGRAWVDYLTRCQALLQLGEPVVDVAVFMGEEMPRRSVLPDRLVSSLPGIFGEDRVKSEETRLAFEGQPLREMPAGVTHSGNMADPEDWIDPLRGYAYDSINRDALLRLATVEDGRIVLPGGGSYAVLVVPQERPMASQGSVLSDELRDKLAELKKQGAVVLENVYEESDFSRFGVAPDFLAMDENGERLHGLPWSHRRLEDAELYFVSNPNDSEKLKSTISVRAESGVPELWNPQTGELCAAEAYSIVDDRIEMPLTLEEAESCFILIRPEGLAEREAAKKWEVAASLGDAVWAITLPGLGQYCLESLQSWSEFEEAEVRAFSGVGVYETSFVWDKSSGELAIDLGDVAELAEVYVNGKSCGLAWTEPFRVFVPSEFLREGDENELRIEVANTWRNRLISEFALPEEERSVWTTAPLDLDGAKPIKSGLLGPVQLMTTKHRLEPRGTTFFYAKETY